MNDFVPWNYAPGGYTPEAEARRIAATRADGRFTIIFGSGDRLLLDFDTEEQWAYFNKIHESLLARFNGVRALCWWHSKSSTGARPRRHVVVQTNNIFPVSHRLIVQAALGSDPKRELFGAMRAENGVLEPSLLFRPKGAELHAIEGIPLLDLIDGLTLPELDAYHDAKTNQEPPQTSEPAW